MFASRILAVSVAAIPLVLAGAGFLALDGLKPAEAAGEPVAQAEIAVVAPVDPACATAVWPHIPAACLDGSGDVSRTVTVLDRPVARP